MYRGIKIYETNSLNYVEWTLDISSIQAHHLADKQMTVMDWFRMISNSDPTVIDAMEFLVSRELTKGTFIGTIHPRNRVLVPRTVRHRDGALMALLKACPAERTRALVAAFFGIRNPTPCTSCILPAARLDKPESYPFDECVSLGGFWGDACANCLWHSTLDCSYQTAWEMEMPVASRTSIESGTGVEGLDKGVFLGDDVPKKQARRFAGLLRMGILGSSDPSLMD